MKNYKVTAQVLGEETELVEEASSLSDAVNMFLNEVRISKITDLGTTNGEGLREYELTAKIRELNITGTIAANDIFGPLYQATGNHILITSVEEEFEEEEFEEE